ncbi:MAG TPA: hypothetical protein VHK67_00615 [Rhabdochlamydiaceae bacterium]|nr:hypothetical protein [Rhabdochlamydiaceae bacterium]
MKETSPDTSYAHQNTKLGNPLNSCISGKILRIFAILSAMVSAIESMIIQNTRPNIWSRLSKEKVIFAAIAAITVYALYKTYKALMGRIEKLTTDLNSTKRELEGLKKTAEETEKASKNLGIAQKKDDSQSESSSTNSDEDDSSDSEPAIQSKKALPKHCSNNGSSNGASVKEATTPFPMPGSHKDVFRLLFPGRDRETVMGEAKTTLADILLTTAFRYDELESVEEAGSSYTLTYKESKTIEIKDLPPDLWGKVSDNIIANVKHALSLEPKIQIANVLKISIECVDGGTQINFNKAALRIASFCKSGGYLKSIFIPSEKSLKVTIEFEHTEPHIPQSGNVSSDEFARLLSFYFNK